MHAAGKGGHGEGVAAVWRLAWPLVVSTSAHTIKLLTDSVLLMGVGRDAMAAAMQGGLISFTAGCFFIGVVGFTNTLVAQYHGAGRPERIGPAVWQGVHLALASGTLLLLLAPCASAIFAVVGHAPSLAALEADFFRLVILASPCALMNEALACFWTGRGLNRTVMAVSTAAAAANGILAWSLIYGAGGLPACGMRGAAYATLAVTIAESVVYAWLFLRPANRRGFAVLSARPDPGLLRRLIVFGAPSGLHLLNDLVSFSAFLALVGRISPEVLAASALAFRVNLVVFLPVVGVGVAVGTLAGQAMGRRDPAAARRAVRSGLVLGLGFTLLLAVPLCLWPEAFLLPFAGMAKAGEFTAISGTVAVFLRFIALYCVFDAANIVLTSMLKSAGDTRFPLLASLVAAWGVMVVPTWLAVSRGSGPLPPWVLISAYVMALTCVFWLRFRSGAWERIEVIEQAPEE